MKIRTGFVSNSSSSSFCIIGTDEAKYIKQLMDAEGLSLACSYEDDSEEGEYLSYGVAEGKVVNFHGSVMVSYAGVEAEPVLQKMTIPEAAKAFKELVKTKLDVDIPLSEINLHYGEAGNG